MNKKIISSVLAGTMSVTMLASPVLAANDAQAIIDVTRTGTINVHKLIENDGTNTAGYGLANPDEDRIPVNNIGYKYLKIADIENIRGIIISTNGDIDWDADNGEVSVGAYYVANEALESLFVEAGVVPDAVYIKDAIRDGGSATAYPTIQYDYNDQKAAEFLKTEQENVDKAEETLASKKAALTTAQNAYWASFYNQNLAAGNESKAQDALTAAQRAQAAAQGAFDAAKDAKDDADEKLSDAQEAFDTAESDFNAAQDDFEDAYGKYQTNDDSTMKLLSDANDAFNDASNSLASANEALERAKNAKDDAQTAFDNADAALKAAQDIYDAATDASSRAALGNPDTIDGTDNAVAYAAIQLNNAQAAYDAANTALNDATSALETAQSDFDESTTALNTAQTKLQEATQNNDDAYTAFKEALDSMNSAQASMNAANSALDDAKEAQADATDELDKATAKLDAAKDAAEKAQSDLDTMKSNNSSATSDLDSKNTAKNTAQSEYNAALTEYKNVVKALDDAAKAGGIMKAYNANTLEAAMKQILATINEDTINKFLQTNGTSVGSDAYGYTDDNGVVSFSGLDLGLYMIAETDISYHDGIAGAWNDKENGGSINNDQFNTYDHAGGTYSIAPVDGQDQGVVHEYKYGEAYREAVNPEWPVIESLSAPFLVSVPTTNAVDTTEDMVAAGDQYGEAGTVWQYTVDVYPKNQTTAIFKRIVDPDETDEHETLRTSEDYQIGDLIEQVIWAEAPALQPNYLDVDNALASNKHLGYVISDTMSDGLTFDKVTKVAVIPASQLKGLNKVDETKDFVYFDPEGNRCTAEEALVNPSDPVNSALKTITKYYDAEGHEVSKEVFEAASELNIKMENEPTQFDNKTQNDISSFSSGYYSRTISYKKIIQQGASYTMNEPSNIEDFAIVKDGSVDMGVELVAGTDYQVVNTDDEEVRMTNYDGDTQTAIAKDTHGFAVVLTASGLEKLNARSTDSVVVVYFDSILNKNASIGQASPANMNYPSLTWVNTNTGKLGNGADGSIFRQIHGNEVYDYTYELVIKKEGVKDATNVKFVISRDDPMNGGDLNQVKEKDLTDSVSQTKSIEQDDSIKFVEEAPGIYHVWGYLAGENSDEGDAESAFETSVVNGVTYNTVTPASDGTLKIKGIDSNDYIFKEIKTEAGKNLLKDTFKVVVRAEDPMRDGRIKTATVSTGSSSPIGITIGAVGTETNDAMVDGSKNLGIASMAVTNYNVIDLRTGGEGTTLIYLCGAALLAAMGTGIIVSNRKKKDIRN